MTQLNRKLAVFSLALLVILLSGYYFYPQESGEGRSSVTLIIRFGDSGKLRAGNITVWEDGHLLSSEESGDNTTFEFRKLKGENQTVFSALLSASECGNFSVEYSQHSFPKGVFVESIAGVENGEKNWQYYLNKEYGSRASDDMQVKDNDIIEWVYE